MEIYLGRLALCFSHGQNVFHWLALALVWFSCLRSPAVCFLLAFISPSWLVCLFPPVPPHLCLYLKRGTKSNYKKQLTAHLQQQQQQQPSFNVHHITLTVYHMRNSSASITRYEHNTASVRWRRATLGGEKEAGRAGVWCWGEEQRGSMTKQKEREERRGEGAQERVERGEELTIPRIPSTFLSDSEGRQKRRGCKDGAPEYQRENKLLFQLIFTLIPNFVSQNWTDIQENLVCYELLWGCYHEHNNRRAQGSSKPGIQMKMWWRWWVRREKE